MPKFVAYLTAVQWIGTNITEIRQVINASGGTIKSATVDPVTQTLSLRYDPELAAMGTLFSPIIVPVNNWVLADGSQTFTLDPTTFAAKYSQIA